MPDLRIIIFIGSTVFFYFFFFLQYVYEILYIILYTQRGRFLTVTRSLVFKIRSKLEASGRNRLSVDKRNILSGKDSQIHSASPGHH